MDPAREHSNRALVDREGLHRVGVAACGREGRRRLAWACPPVPGRAGAPPGSGAGVWPGGSAAIDPAASLQGAWLGKPREFPGGTAVAGLIGSPLIRFACLVPSLVLLRWVEMKPRANPLSSVLRN
jgi:hypothetical protein